MEGKLIIDKAHSNLAGRSRNKTSGQKQLEKFGSEMQLRISCYMWITQMERSHFYLNGMIHKVERRVRSWTREEISHFQVQLQQPCEKWHVGGFFSCALQWNTELNFASAFFPWSQLSVITRRLNWSRQERRLGFRNEGEKYRENDIKVSVSSSSKPSSSSSRLSLSNTDVPTQAQ